MASVVMAVIVNGTSDFKDPVKTSQLLQQKPVDNSGPSAACPLPFAGPYHARGRETCDEAKL